MIVEGNQTHEGGDKTKYINHSLSLHFKGASAAKLLRRTKPRAMKPKIWDQRRRRRRTPFDDIVLIRVSTDGSGVDSSSTPQRSIRSSNSPMVCTCWNIMVCTCWNIVDQALRANTRMRNITATTSHVWWNVNQTLLLLLCRMHRLLLLLVVESRWKRITSSVIEARHKRRNIRRTSNMITTTNFQILIGRLWWCVVVQRRMKREIPISTNTKIIIIRTSWLNHSISSEWWWRRPHQQILLWLWEQIWTRRRRRRRRWRICFATLHFAGTATNGYVPEGSTECPVPFTRFAEMTRLREAIVVEVAELGVHGIAAWTFLMLLRRRLLLLNLSFLLSPFFSLLFHIFVSLWSELSVVCVCFFYHVDGVIIWLVFIYVSYETRLVDWIRILKACMCFRFRGAV